MRTKLGRARPLAVEDRQAMIIDATIPLLLQHGRAITSKQIAEGAGIAEGTVFRAFGDKDTLIRAAIDHYLDPGSLRNDLRAIDLLLPLDEKIGAMLALMQRRFRGIFGMYAVLGEHGEPPKRPDRQEFGAIIDTLLEPNRAELAWEPQQIANAIRLVALASSLPHMGDDSLLDNVQLTNLITHGVVAVAP